MTANVEALTTATLSLALDAATLRQQVIAANIANVGTVGYVPRRVSFEAQLASALNGSSPSGATSSFAPLMRVEPDLGSDGQPRPLQLDQEVAALAQNNLHYQALVKGLNQHLSLMTSAVTEGKR
jgi:flagellar basal-body rod protein FlgB